MNATLAPQTQKTPGTAGSGPSRNGVIRCKSLMSGQFGGTELVLAEGTVITNKPTERQQKHEDKAAAIKQWATDLLQEDGDEWTEYHCSRVIRSTMNAQGQTRAFVKWMKDSREECADKSDNRKYPIIRVHSTVDAPLEQVCHYLSQEKRVKEYNNDLMSPKHRDLEALTPHSKICVAQTRQILVIKPRQLVSFCHHRWTSDDTQIVVCEATDDFKDDSIRVGAKVLRAATFIGRDPKDAKKTRIIMINHLNPGKDIPHWALKTVVNAIVPIEPFRCCYLASEGVKRDQSELNCTVPADKPGQVTRPAGLCMLGYACFWPNGGGTLEGPHQTNTNLCKKVEDPAGQ